MNKHGETAFAFLAGAATGAIAALLLAPEKGEVSRKRLKEGAEDLYKKGKELAKETREVVEGKTREVVSAARQKIEELGGTVKRQAAAVREAIAEGKEAYHRELEHTSKS